MMVLLHSCREDSPSSYDGKYTATLLETGVNGAILFWHDTTQLRQ